MVRKHPEQQICLLTGSWPGKDKEVLLICRHGCVCVYKCVCMCCHVETHILVGEYLP